MVGSYYMKVTKLKVEECRNSIGQLKGTAQTIHNALIFNNYDILHYSTWHIVYYRSHDAFTWSPHSLIMGMLTSSTKTVILRPPGGPYVVPTRLST